MALIIKRVAQAAPAPVKPCLDRPKQALKEIAIRLARKAAMEDHKKIMSMEGPTHEASSDLFPILD